MGRVRVGHTLHSEVATLPLHFADRGIRSVSFKVGFPAAFMDKLALLTALGLADTSPVELPSGTVVPRELLVHCITRTAISPRPRGRPGRRRGDLGPGARATGRTFGGSGPRPSRHPRSPDGVLRNSPSDLSIERLAECVVRPHPAWQAGAGQLDTGVPPSIVAQFLATKVIDRPGVLAPEDAVPPEPFLAELADAQHGGDAGHPGEELP